MTSVFNELMPLEHIELSLGAIYSIFESKIYINLTNQTNIPDYCNRVTSRRGVLHLTDINTYR